MKAENIKSILIVALVALSGFFYLQNRKANIKNDTHLSILEEQQDSLRTVVLANGKIKQEKQAAVIEASEAKKALEFYKKEKDDILNNHDVEIKQLHSYYSARMRATGSGVVPVKDTVFIWNDSIIHDTPTFEINDGFLTFGAAMVGKEYYYGYTYEDEYSIVPYWTQKGIWPFRRNDKLMVSFSNKNPSSKFTEARVLVFEEKKKDHFTHGPVTAIGISSQGDLTWFAGYGVMWAFGRF